MEMEYPSMAVSPGVVPLESSSPIPLINSTHKQSPDLHLTWKDLWVTVPDKVAGRRHILRGLTGYVTPAKVLAVLGPSGSGKSTLLDALSGRLNSNARQKGDILINGRRQTLAFGTSVYLTQDDSLVSSLTVREAVYYSAQLQLPDYMSKSDKRKRAEATIKEMGLESCMDTRIGGWHVKGISGGQKRRVSICIEILRRPKLLFLDEPTSGLDSSASYHVMKSLINLAKIERISVIASLHQPSSEVFDLFHNLCLLSSGQTLFFGPTAAANEFFASNGFISSSMRNPCDYYLRTINQDFDHMDVEHGFGGKSAVGAIDVLVKAYDSSDIFIQVKQCVDEIFLLNNNNNKSMEEKGSQAGFIRQCVVLTERSAVNMFRDLGYYWFRFVIHMGLCISVGTIFYHLGSDYTSIQARCSVLVFISTFMSFMALGGFPSFAEDMKIFTRERLNGHYSVAAFVVGNTASSIPFLLLLSVLPGAIPYHLIGLQRTFHHFSYFSLLLFTCMVLTESIMMVVAAIVPDFLLGVMAGAGIQGLAILVNGFFRLPNSIPKIFWKIPLYYISFHNYTNQGFYKNEFHGLIFRREDGVSAITGDQILEVFWEMQMGHSKWVDLGIMCGITVVLRLNFWGIIMAKEKFKPVIMRFLTPSSKLRLWK